MFFRIKKIKAKEYVYIVENEWKRTGSRQKVKQYIGRVYKFDLKNDLNFQQFVHAENIGDYIIKNSPDRIIRDLIEWEFFKFGINGREIFLDLNKKKIQKNKKNIALAINDGFMCGPTIKKLIEFKAENNDEENGYKLARAFVEAGIMVPQEVFIGFFSKLCQKPTI